MFGCTGSCIRLGLCHTSYWCDKAGRPYWQFGSDVIEAGCDSLLNGVVCRIENQLQASKRRRSEVTYNSLCAHRQLWLNWLSDAHPEGDTVHDQKAKQYELVGTVFDEKTEATVIRAYYLQRVDVMSGGSMADLMTIQVCSQTVAPSVFQMCCSVWTLFPQLVVRE